MPIAQATDEVKETGANKLFTVQPENIKRTMLAECGCLPFNIRLSDKVK